MSVLLKQFLQIFPYHRQLAKKFLLGGNRIKKKKKLVHLSEKYTLILLGQVMFEQGSESFCVKAKLELDKFQPVRKILFKAIITGETSQNSV